MLTVEDCPLPFVCVFCVVDTLRYNVFFLTIGKIFRYSRDSSRILLQFPVQDFDRKNIIN